MVKLWYVVHTHPHKERVVHQQLQDRKIEVFYPRLRTNAKSGSRERSYFPRYLFVKIDLNKCGVNTFKHMPFTNGLVCYGQEPASVPEALIVRLDQRLQMINSASPDHIDDLKPGASVRIESGEFAGYQAIFDSYLSGKERARILLQLLGSRQLGLELPSRDIRPSESPNRFQQ